MTTNEELIARLRKGDGNGCRASNETMDRAAEALEKLEAERDELLAELDRVAEHRGRLIEERNALAAVVEQVRQWRHDWFNEPIEGVKRKPHHRRLDDVLDAAPSVALDRVRAEALREAADGFRFYKDYGYRATVMLATENYLNERADRIEKGEK